MFKANSKAVLARSDPETEPISDSNPGAQLNTVVGIFAGIGGIEEGFRRQGFKSTLLCEIDPAARKVLTEHFPEAHFESDLNGITALPSCTVVAAGFPCQDLSQVGRRQGIHGPNSGLIWKLLELIRAMPTPPEWLVLENVPFMLKLDQGRGIRAIVNELEALGFSWAYRTIDARCFGLPQRRRRVVLLASKTHDPRPALLDEDVGEPDDRQRKNAARGFYWTEGNTGIGWAENAIPPLKGGSSIHIASPPAVWFPQRRTFITPDIRDAERLQGFPADWSKAAEQEKGGRRQRWRLVGNAVSVPMAEWIASRLKQNPPELQERNGKELDSQGGWPAAAWGIGGRRFASSTSEWPVRRQYSNLATFLKYRGNALSKRAASGFLFRLERSQLRYSERFADDLRHYVNSLK